MWESLRKYLTHISEGFSAKYRWLFLLLILGVLFFIFLVVEHYSGWCYYSNMSKKIAILEGLQSLTDSGIMHNKQLIPIFNQTVSDISADQITRFQFTGKATLLWKAVSGASIGFLILIAALAASKKNRNKKGAMIVGSLFFTIVSVLVAISLPTLGFPFVNYIGVPVAALFVLVLITKFYKRGVLEKVEAVSCRSSMRSISSAMTMFNAKHNRFAVDLAELSTILSNAPSLTCPSCKRTYRLIVLENDYSVVCPNEPSHGAVNKYLGGPMSETVKAMLRRKKGKKGE